MANEKFKLYGVNGDGDIVLADTVNHPKLDASQSALNNALTSVTGLYDLDPVRIDLTSDTTIFTAE